MANSVKTPAEVCSVTAIADNVYDIILSPVRRIPRFKPGQFLHMAIDDYNETDGFWPESRVFSIASSPQEKTIRIIYSVKGVFTKRMESFLHKSAYVWLKLPYGDFVIPHFINHDSEVVMIAGGTGISPFLSFLNDSHNTIQTGRLSLYWGVKNEKIFSLWKPNNRNTYPLSVHLYNEEKSLSFSTFPVLQGQLDIMQILKHESKSSKVVYFISGPPLMVREFKKVLIDAGVDPAQVIIDAWE